MKPCMSVELPGFPGFYHSDLDESVDLEASNWAEWEADERELEHPEELRLDAGELGELLFRHQRHKDTYAAMARAWADAFAYRAKEVLGFDLGLVFDEMVSPREYNFGTDRVFAHLPYRAVRQLWAVSRGEGHETLARIIREDCTSRSGFSSFYPNDLATWRQKPSREWDHNEVSILLKAALDVRGRESDGDRFWRYWDQNLVDDVIGDGGAYEYFERTVDWPALDAAIDDARRAKADAIGQDVSWRNGPVYAHPDQAPLALGA